MTLYLKILSPQNLFSQTVLPLKEAGAEIVKKYTPPTMCHMSSLTCHMSHACINGAYSIKVSLDFFSTIQAVEPATLPEKYKAAGSTVCMVLNFV